MKRSHESISKQSVTEEKNLPFNQIILELERKLLESHHTQKFDDMFKYANQILLVNSEHAFALRSRGEVYRTWSNLDAALDDLNHSLHIQPNDELALSSRGDVYRQKKAFVNALNDFNRALELNPNNFFSLRARSIVYYQQGNFSCALKDLDDALKLKPRDVSVLTQRANVHRKNENLDAALNDLNQALSIKNKDEALYSTRGDIFFERKNFNFALGDYLKSTQIKETSKILNKIVLVYHKLNNLSKATEFEYKAHQAEKKEKAKIPTLLSLTKWTIFKTEQDIYTRGYVFKSNSQALRNALADNKITPVTLAAMRGFFDESPSYNHVRSIFDQLDMIDMHLSCTF